MREIKFEYIFKHNDWKEDDYDKSIFTLQQIRDWEVDDYLICAFGTNNGYKTIYLITG